MVTLLENPFDTMKRFCLYSQCSHLTEPLDIFPPGGWMLRRFRWFRFFLNTIRKEKTYNVLSIKKRQRNDTYIQNTPNLSKQATRATSAKMSLFFVVPQWYAKCWWFSLLYNNKIRGVKESKYARPQRNRNIYVCMYGHHIPV